MITVPLWKIGDNAERQGRRSIVQSLIFAFEALVYMVVEEGDSWGSQRLDHALGLHSCTLSYTDCVSHGPTQAMRQVALESEVE